MKVISVVVPLFNEETNVEIIYERIKELFCQKLKTYLYEILFIDNYSTDNTRLLVSNICNKDKNVKAIFNAANFGFIRSTFYGLTHTSGDCSVLLFADLQDPPELIYDFVREWESGHKIVLGIKTKSKENRLVYFLRTIFYKLIKTISTIDHIEHFTGFGLYDKTFIDVLKKLDDSLPYLRGIVAELSSNKKEIFYKQSKRERGESSFHFFKLYDLAMLGITSYSRGILQLATILGFIFSIFSFIVALITLIAKLIFWDKFPFGVAALLVGTFFIGSLQIFFIGFLGEYILNINTRLLKRPLVVEERRINFD